MTKLVIHAPSYRVKRGSESFETILEKGRGKGYILSQNDINILSINSNTIKVVLIRKDRNQKRAEGLFAKKIIKNKTPTGKQRYDIYFKDMKVVHYKPEKLNRYGVAVTDY